MTLDKYDIEFRDTLKQSIENRTGLKLTTINSKDINTNKGYTVGNKYYISNWDSIDECISIDNGYIIVKGQDGIIRNHITTLDTMRDFIIV